MTRFKIFIVLAILCATSFSAHAGLRQCLQSLLGIPVTPAKQKPGALVDKKDPEFRKFIQNRRANPNAKPPVGRVTESTSPSNMVTDFQYWWFPGNIWHSLMVTDYVTQDQMSRELNGLFYEFVPTAAFPEFPVEVQPTTWGSVVFSGDWDSSSEGTSANSGTSTETKVEVNEGSGGGWFGFGGDGSDGGGGDSGGGGE